MTRTITICDGCGKHLCDNGKLPKSGIFVTFHTTTCEFDKEWDLCDECLAKMRTILKDIQKENGYDGEQ